MKYNFREKNNCLDVSDIMADGKKFKSKRITDIMNPRYMVPTGTGRRVREIGEIEKSSPHNSTGFETISPVKIRELRANLTPAP
jgi:hypothetical protein